MDGLYDPFLMIFGMVYSWVCHINTHNLAQARSRPRLWAFRPRAPDQLRDFLTHAIPMSACVVLDLSALSGKSSILATHIHTTSLKEIVV